MSRATFVGEPTPAISTYTTIGFGVPMRNTLFEPYRRNHAQRSKPLGTWTRRDNKNAPDPDEEDEDE